MSLIVSCWVGWIHESLLPPPSSSSSCRLNWIIGRCVHCTVEELHFLLHVLVDLHFEPVMVSEYHSFEACDLVLIISYSSFVFFMPHHLSVLAFSRVCKVAPLHPLASSSLPWSSSLSIAADGSGWGRWLWRASARAWLVAQCALDHHREGRVQTGRHRGRECCTLKWRAPAKVKTVLWPLSALS